MRRYRLPMVPAFGYGFFGVDPKKQAGLGGTVSPSSWLAPSPHHRAHWSPAFATWKPSLWPLKPKRGKGRGPVTFDVKMLLKNLETELQHTTFDGTCLTFYTMMLGWDFSPMNVQLPETLKKVIQQYLISWMFHNTVCGEGTPIHKTLLIWKYVFRIPKTCDFTTETLGANPQGPCFNCFQTAKAFVPTGPRSFSTKAGLFFSKGKIAQVIGATHGWNLRRFFGGTKKSNSNVDFEYPVPMSWNAQNRETLKNSWLCQCNNLLPSYFKFNTLLAKRKTQSRQKKNTPYAKTKSQYQFFLPCTPPTTRKSKNDQAIQQMTYSLWVSWVLRLNNDRFSPSISSSS